MCPDISRLRSTCTVRISRGDIVVDFDNLKDQVEKVAAEHQDVIEKISDEVIEHGGDVVNRTTGDTYAEVLLKGGRVLDERIGE
jgi:SepF-like predicted cell division protein (DUF552 family)